MCMRECKTYAMDYVTGSSMSLFSKSKQKEISVVHLQTRLSARNNASREAQKEPTGQATSYFLSKALSATKKAKLIMLSAHILQAWCNAPRA